MVKNNSKEENLTEGMVNNLYWSRSTFGVTH